jgi:hypothetical protein
VTWLELFAFGTAAAALSCNKKADILSTSSENVDIMGAQGVCGANPPGLVRGSSIPGELIKEGLVVPNKWL